MAAISGGKPVETALYGGAGDRVVETTTLVASDALVRRDETIRQLHAQIKQLESDHAEEVMTLFVEHQNTLATVQTVVDVELPRTLKALEESEKRNAVQAKEMTALLATIDQLRAVHAETERVLREKIVALEELVATLRK